MADGERQRRAPRAYAYRCEDKSLLTAWIARVLAPPVQRLLPRAVTPNHVTAAGSALCWIAAGALWLLPAGQAAAALLGVTLLWSYCVLDHVDGLHARLTGRSSAWGEYLDHALDAWNVSLVIAMIALMQPDQCRPEIVVLAIAAAGLATSGVWLEQYERGSLLLGPVGPVEALLLAGLYLLSWSLPHAAEFWSRPLGLGALSRADAVLLTGVFGSALCAAAVWRAAPGARRPLLLLAGEFVATAVVGFAGGIPWWITAIVLAMAAAIYAGRVIAAYLNQAAQPRPDWLGPIGLGLAALLLRTGGSPALAWIVPVGLAGRALLAWSAARRRCRRVT